MYALKLQVEQSTSAASAPIPLLTLGKTFFTLSAPTAATDTNMSTELHWNIGNKIRVVADVKSMFSREFGLVGVVTL